MCTDRLSLLFAVEQAADYSIALFSCFVLLHARRYSSGLELLRQGKAPRAKKLVVRVRDTPAADVTHLGVRTELGWNGVV